MASALAGLRRRLGLQPAHEQAGPPCLAGCRRAAPGGPGLSSRPARLHAKHLGRAAAGVAGRPPTAHGRRPPAGLPAVAADLRRRRLGGRPGGNSPQAPRRALDFPPGDGLPGAAGGSLGPAAARGPVERDLQHVLHPPAGRRRLPTGAASWKAVRKRPRRAAPRRPW